jgi:hypothetical protein
MNAGDDAEVEDDAGTPAAPSGGALSPQEKRRSSRSLMLLATRDPAVRSELQAVETVVTIDKKLKADSAISAAHRDRLALLAQKKDALNKVLLRACGVGGAGGSPNQTTTTALRRIGVLGHHLDEYCREVPATTALPEPADLQLAIASRARHDGSSHSKSGNRSGRRRGNTVRNAVGQPTPPTTARMEKVYYYHSPQMCQV